MAIYPPYPDIPPLWFPAGGVADIYPVDIPADEDQGEWITKPYYDQSGWIYQGWCSSSLTVRGYYDTYETYAQFDDPPVFNLPTRYIDLPAYYRISGFFEGIYYDGEGNDGNFGSVVDPADFPDLTEWTRVESRVVWPGEEYRANPINYSLSRIDAPVYQYDVGDGWKYYTQYAEATWDRPQRSVVIYKRRYLAGQPLPGIPASVPVIVAPVAALGVLAFLGFSAGISTSVTGRRRKF